MKTILYGSIAYFKKVKFDNLVNHLEVNDFITLVNPFKTIRIDFIKVSKSCILVYFNLTFIDFITNDTIFKYLDYAEMCSTLCYEENYINNLLTSIDDFNKFLRKEFSYE